MKKKHQLLILLLFVVVNLANSQEITKEPSVINTIERINSTSDGSTINLETKLYNFTETIPPADNPTDSANFQFKERSLNIKSVRINTEQIEKTFPEAVNYDIKGNPNVDYQSVVSLMYEAIIKQQKKIEELEGRIKKMER